LNREHILVVDDSEQVRAFLADMVLGPEGFTVEVARDGVEGLATAMLSPPDLIITDLAMPELDGLQLVEELRRNGHNFPIILMTAEGSEDIAVRALRAGVTDYFTKPFDGGEMLQAVRRVLRSARTTLQGISPAEQRRIEALNTLIAIGKSVTALLDLEMVLGRVVEAAVYLTRAEEGTLMLIDPATDELYIRAAKNLDDHLARTLRLPVHDSLAGRVIQTGEPLVIGGEGMQKIKTHYLVRSLLYVPLRVGDQIVGVLGVDNRITDKSVSRQDVGILSALADYAAIAIENARLFSTGQAELSKLQAVLEQTADAVMLVGPDGVISLCNAMACEMFWGPGAPLPVGHRLEHAVRNQDLLGLLERLDDSVARGEVALEDGRTLNATISKIEGVGRVAVMQDITHLKELDRIKGEFVTTVSHDLRSPLTAILSYVELLGRAGPLNEQQQDFVERIRFSVRSVTALISNLLELGKIEAGLDRERAPVNISMIARYAVEALQPQAAAKEQTIHLDSADQLGLHVLGNAVRLRQAVSNLVENAVKYTPEGGRIEVAVHSEDDQVVIYVSDNGIGIPLADQPHIFDKFFRSHQATEGVEGTGLGLSIVKSIIENHDGRIWVESRVGEGSTFTVVLPAYRSDGGAKRH
jgi:signal transduction histidine kinase/DNA-binding response OmpR family regulator